MIKRILEGQSWNLGLTLIFTVILQYLLQIFPDSQRGEFWFGSTESWIVIAATIPILHQFYVFICWRLELYGNFLSRKLGNRAFILYKIDFSIFLIARPISILFLSISNSNSIGLSTVISLCISGALMIPLAALLHSVTKYFGYDRAIGKDHFSGGRERLQPLIRKGIFILTPNAIYVFGFLLLHVIALLSDSLAGLFLAAYNHALIWLHYFFVEKADLSFMQKKWGSNTSKLLFKST